MLLLMRKDLLQGWRTFRLPALVLTAVFFGLLEPLTARYMPELLSLLAQELPGLAEIIPPMGPPEALASYLGDLTQIGALVLIIIAMGSIALERERGIAAWVLTRPVSRTAYLWSKYLSQAAGLAVALLCGGVLAVAYTGTLFGSVPAAGAAWAIFFTGIFLLLVLAVTVAASAFLRSQLAAGGVGLAFLFLIWLPELLFGGFEIVRYFPHVLSGRAAGLLAGTLEWSYFVPAALVTIALSGGIVALSALSFRRAEL